MKTCEITKPDETARTVAPRTTIIGNSSGWRLICDLPGIEQNGLEITLDRRVLKISGKPGETTTDSESTNLLREFSSRSFERKFSLGQSADESGIRANLRNGLLEVTLPRRAESAPRVILLDS